MTVWVQSNGKYISVHGIIRWLDTVKLCGWAENEFQISHWLCIYTSCQRKQGHKKINWINEVESTLSYILNLTLKA